MQPSALRLRLEERRHAFASANSLPLQSIPKARKIFIAHSNAIALPLRILLWSVAVKKNSRIILAHSDLFEILWLTLQDPNINLTNDRQGDRMRWVTAYQKELHVQERCEESIAPATPGFTGAITADAVHELLFDPSAGELPPFFPALIAARATKEAAEQTLIWIDPAKTFYPPAVIGSIVQRGKLDLVRPEPQDIIWAATECLRCKQVGAVVALIMHRPTPVEVRRLQLAAEQGGGVGVLVRPNLASAGVQIYAAATRWRVSPVRGDRMIQRWKIQQIYGQGRWTDSSFILERHRATGKTNFVYPSAPLVDHPLLSASS